MSELRKYYHFTPDGGLEPDRNGFSPHPDTHCLVTTIDYSPSRYPKRVRQYYAAYKEREMVLCFVEMPGSLRDMLYQFEGRVVVNFTDIDNWAGFIEIEIYDTWRE